MKCNTEVKVGRNSQVTLKKPENFFKGSNKTNQKLTINLVMTDTFRRKYKVHVYIMHCLLLILLSHFSRVQLCVTP